MKVRKKERPEDKFIRRINEIVSGKDILPELLQTIDELRDTISEQNAYITRLESEISKYKAELQAGVLVEPRQIITTTHIYCGGRVI